MLKVAGMAIDAVRTAAWVRRHDVVIVPGAGVLEASLPMLPRGWPYAMFLLGVSGRMLRTKVAMVSVGAGQVNQPVTNWLFNTAARLAYYRSYRDAGAREAMRSRGQDVSRDQVYPDLAFSLPAPAPVPVDKQLVALGVMDYRGTNDERDQADEISARYIGDMKRFAGWLVDNGRKVLLIVGDANGSDSAVADEIMADLRASRPNLDPAAATAPELTRYADVMRVLLPVNSVVAIRYHNILCALKMEKPTISIGYSPKHDVVMANMGLAEFGMDVSALDVAELMARFTELELQADKLREVLAEHNQANIDQVNELFAELDSRLF
jgi:polysaccharide pyruvyl transferase WcaK-like protein